MSLSEQQEGEQQGASSVEHPQVASAIPSNDNQGEGDKEEESLEALVSQLNGITGCVMAVDRNESDPTNYTTRNKSSAVTKDDVSMLLPDKITITTQLAGYESLQDKLGFGLEQSRDAVVLSNIADTSPLANLWAMGAQVVLTSVNRQACTSLQQTHILIARATKQSHGNGKLVTLECHVNKPDDYEVEQRIVQAIVYKPTPVTTLGIRFGNSFPASDDVGPSAESDDENETQRPGSMLLTVHQIVRQGLLGQSCISRGDVILALQGKPCHDLNCDDAANYLKSATGLVSILACTNENSNKQRSGLPSWRSMASSPLKLIPPAPTLPPVGKLLGTKRDTSLVEGPKRMVQSCRNTLGTAMMKRSGQEEEQLSSSKTTDKEMEGSFENNQDDANAIRARAAAIIASSENSSSSNHNGNNKSPFSFSSPGTLQRRSVKDRLSNFGRRHVMPLLDGIVGDQSPDDPNDDAQGRGTLANTESGNQRMTTTDVDKWLSSNGGESFDDESDDDEEEVDENDFDMKNYSFEDSDEDDYSWLSVDLDTAAQGGKVNEGGTTNA